MRVVFRSCGVFTIAAVFVGACGENSGPAISSHAAELAADGGVIGMEVPGIPEPPPAWEGVRVGPDHLIVDRDPRTKSPAELLVARLAGRSEVPLLVRATVVSLENLAEPTVVTEDKVQLRVQTRASFVVGEELCGREVEPTLAITYEGGVLDGEAVYSSSYPTLAVGEEYVLAVDRTPSGPTLHAGNRDTLRAAGSYVTDNRGRSMPVSAILEVCP